MAKKDQKVLLELGAKLANFRRKLAISIGQKKITQAEFGEMYGGLSCRMVTSYEGGVVDPPASLFYLLWQGGHSIDAIFSESNITESGIEGAKLLYDQCALASVKTLDLNRQFGVESTLEEKFNEETQLGAHQETPGKAPCPRKTSVNKTRKVKKRR